MINLCFRLNIFSLKYKCHQKETTSKQFQNLRTPQSQSQIKRNFWQQKSSRHLQVSFLLRFHAARIQKQSV